MTASAFVIEHYGRRFLAHMPRPPEGYGPAMERGWRPYRWVRDLTDAEKFGSWATAALFLSGLRGPGGAIREIQGRAPGGAA